MRKLLDGVRVIEHAVLLNGGMVGSLLGDLGADVVKVESPGRGDYLRDMLGQITPHHSPAHLQVNRQKRSLTIDLTSDAGRDIFWRLLDTADVFVDGFLAGATDRLGIGYDAQVERRPSIVYCQHTGFGATAPYGDIPTHGFMQEALASATPMEIGPDGYPKPKHIDFSYSPQMMRAGSSVPTGALQSAFHISAALVHAQRTGEGCYIDVSAADSTIANGFPTTTYELNEHRITSQKGMPKGNVESTGADAPPRYQYYEASDGKFVLFCAIETKFWNRFCDAVDRPDMKDDLSVAETIDWGSGDLDQRAQLVQLFRTRTQREWVELAATWRVPIGPVHERPHDLLGDPQLRAREVFLDADHPEAGTFTYIGSPALIRDQPFEIVRHAPELGQHTEEILAELGFTAEERRDLQATGTV
jgi:crotonobetainyl-CoA:carnitine CoA-transferase CaiB-like acyl-CoA transferase